VHGSEELPVRAAGVLVLHMLQPHTHTHTHTHRDSILGLGKRKKGLWIIGGCRKGDYEFADDALVDEDWDDEAEEADDGEAAAGPAKVQLEVLAAGVPLFDPPVLVHLHAASHILLNIYFSLLNTLLCLFYFTFFHS
jgi:hypothetical protein